MKYVNSSLEILRCTVKQTKEARDVGVNGRCVRHGVSFSVAVIIYGEAEKQGERVDFRG